jgi:hypothetical protein
MLPCNVEKFNVCNNHSNPIYASRFKYCCLCKSLGYSKTSKSGLRIINKLYAFAAWKQSKVRLSFGRKMCTRCRHDLDQSLMTEEVKEEFNVIFQWLYDVNLIHTPSIASSDSYHMLSQSFNNLVAEEKREHLKRFLEGNFIEFKLQSPE